MPNWVAVLIAVVCICFPLIFIVPVALRGLRNRRLLRHGLTARATVARLMTTGAAVDDQIVLEVILTVEPAEGPHFEATARQQFSLLDVPQLQPGQIVTVNYDRTNPSAVVVRCQSRIGR